MGTVERERARHFSELHEVENEIFKSVPVRKLLSLPFGFIKIGKEAFPQRPCFMLSKQPELMIARHFFPRIPAA